MCTPSIVSEIEQRRIAAYGASFRNATGSPFGAEAGVPIIEILQLEELAAAKVWEFAFVGACLNCAEQPPRRCARLQRC